MKPVYQPIVGDKGTCLSACVASILEVPEEVVGDLLDGWDESGHWVEYVNARLFEKFGKALSVCLLPPMGYSIGIGPSRRMPHLHHAAVCLDGFIIHDPLPHGADLKDIEAFYQIHTVAMAKALIEGENEENQELD